MIVYVVSPPPSTVVNWFALFQRNPLLGLLAMDLLLIVDYALLGLVFLALWAALRRASPSFTAIALTLELVAVATYFSSTAAFEMLSLSHQHTAATTDAERAMFLAAGQAMLAIWQGTAFDVSYILSGIALLMISVVMLHSRMFSKVTASAGIVGRAAALVPSAAGTVGLILSLISLVPLVLWLILVARTLFHLAQGGSGEAVEEMGRR